MGRVIAIRKDLPSTWPEALEQFLWFKQAHGLSEETIAGYKKDISQFFRRNPEAWKPERLKPLALAYMSEKVKPATFNLRLSYLGAFLDWCVKEGIFPENPLKGIKRRRADGRVVQHEAEILSRLIDLPDKKTFAGLRDYALILLTLDTGIRPKEAFSLLKADINLRSLEVYVRAEAAKTRISRTLPVSVQTAQAIKDLINARHPAWNDSVPVFCTSEGTPMNRFSWAERLRAYSKTLGIQIRPYDLRHSFALYYLRNGGNALALQRTMGHSDLSMTKRYVALTQQDLREQHAIASPLNTLLPRRNRVRKVRDDA